MNGRWSLGIVLTVAMAGCDSARLEGAAHAAPAPAVAPRGDDARSLAVVREALASRDYATRLFAVEALGQVRGVDVVPALERALGDPEHDVRVAAVQSLRRAGSSRACDALRLVRDDKDESLDIRALAASALLSRGAD
jgi:HEAT repeat protein